MNNRIKAISTKKWSFLLFRGVIGFCGIITSAFCFFSTSLNVFASDDSHIRIEGEMDPMALPWALILLFLGSAIIIGTAKDFTSKKKRCTHLITATVIDLKAHYSKSNSTYSPIYHFGFNGMEYTVTTSSSRAFALPKIGSQTKLHINPIAPTEFYCTSTIIETILILSLGLGMICLGVIASRDFITFTTFLLNI